MAPIRLLCVVSLLACALSAHAEVREFTYNVDTEVDVDGRIVNADVIAEIDPAFEASVVGLMKQWQFTPAIKDGKAVTARTVMWIEVAADITDEQHAQVSARYLSHGSKVLNPQPPHYPMDAMRFGGQAEVVLEVSWNADGIVTAIEPFQIRVTRGNKEMAKCFHAAAHNAVTTWKMRPEIVDGVPVASHQLIPIKVTIQNAVSGPLRTTFDRSTEISDNALKAAAARLDINHHQHGVAIGNSTGLELISDDRSS